MEGVHVRTPREDESGRLAEFVNAHGLAIEGEAAVDAAEIADWFRTPDAVFLIAEDGDEIVGYADVEHRLGAGRFWLDLRLAPGKGALAGSALLDAAAAWARGRAGPGALLRPVVSSNDATGRGVLEAADFHLVRHSFEMRIDLADEPAAPEWPAGISARPFEPGHDERRIYEAEQEAFADHWEFEPVTFERWQARHASLRDPSLCFVAEDGAEVAGLSLCRVHASGDPTHGYVETLAVRRPWRRRGVGLALLRHSFREFRRRGMTRASLGVDAENLTGAVRLYERAGMYVASRSDTYEKALAG